MIFVLADEILVLDKICVKGNEIECRRTASRAFCNAVVILL